MKMDCSLLLCFIVCVFYYVEGAPVTADIWKNLSEKNAFIINRPLNEMNSFTIIGRTKNYKTVMLKLVKVNAEGNPDYNHVSCQVNINFKNADSNKETIGIIYDGTPENEQWEKIKFRDEKFTVTFSVNEMGDAIELHPGDSTMINECIWTDDTDTTLLIVEGDVAKIDHFELNFKG